MTPVNEVKHEEDLWRADGSDKSPYPGLPSLSEASAADAGNFTDDWYGFKKSPFHVTPDSGMIFSHRRYEEAFSALQYGVFKGKGFVVITGEVGAGKTTLMRHFIHTLGKDVRTAVIFNTGLDGMDLLRAVADDLDIKLPAAGGESSAGGGSSPGGGSSAVASRRTIIDGINDTLVREFAADRLVVLFVDEAQNLSVEALESLRMLSNLETENDKLLQIVLFGQPGLQDMLARPELLQLRSRIAVTYHLMPMDIDETGAYISHRLSLAEPTRPVVFSKKAVAALHDYSSGRPRLINILCDQCLLAAGTQHDDVVEADVVESVIAGFDHLDRVAVKPRPFWVWPALALASLIAVYAGLAGVRSLRHALSVSASEPSVVAEVDAKSSEVIATSASSRPGAAAGSPMGKLLASLGVTAQEGYDHMTVPAIASATGLNWKRLSISPATAEALGLPAILMPGNPVLLNTSPAVILEIHGGIWTAETLGLGREGRVDRVRFPLHDGEVSLYYLFPAKPYMARTMRRGSEGEHVRAAQAVLKRAGLYNRPGDGRFDSDMSEAVHRLQERYKIRQDGVIGSETMLALYALDVKTPTN